MPHRRKCPGRCAALRLACCAGLFVWQAFADNPSWTGGFELDTLSEDGQDSVMLIQMLEERLVHSAGTKTSDGALAEVKSRKAWTQVSHGLRIAIACAVYGGLVAVAFIVNRKAGLAALWFAATGIYYACANVDILTGAYASVQILTTVGYGDIVPTTALGKVGMIFIVFSGLVLIAGFVSELIDTLADHELQLLRSGLQQVESRIRHRNRTVQPVSVSSSNVPLLMSFLFYLAFVLAGTIFFAIVEQCSCGFGSARVQGCVQERCSTTGGIIKTPLDAAYFAVITVSTVGFGDYVANSRAGQIFSIAWIFLGVTAMGAFVTGVTRFLQRRKRERNMENNVVSCFDKSRQDGKDTLTRLDFLVMQLKANGLVEPEVLEDLLRHFDLIDTSGNGLISLEEMAAYCHPTFAANSQ